MLAQKVLVIEDEKGAREALESLLREEGYNVRAAPSGNDGLDCFQEFNPEIVLCDYYLPDIDGLQVLRRIRQSSNGSVRFIMVTAGLSGVENERALRREADAFLAKPIDLAKLHSALRVREPAVAKRVVH
jgi:CheY-like chemotaxis protein